MLIFPALLTFKIGPLSSCIWILLKARFQKARKEINLLVTIIKLPLKNLVASAEWHITVFLNVTNEDITRSIDISASYLALSAARVSNRRDSLLINYSVFSHPPQPYSALPIYWFWRILQASPFIPDPPFINSCAQSVAVAWSLGKATKLFDVRVFLLACHL